MADIQLDTPEPVLLTEAQLKLLAARLNSDSAHAAFDHMFFEVNPERNGLFIHVTVEGQYCPVNTTTTMVDGKIEARMPSGTVIVFKRDALDQTHPRWNN